MGVGVSFLYAVFSFIAYYFQTSATTPWSGAFKIILLATNLLLVLTYWLAYKSAKTFGDKGILKIIYLFSVVFCLIMIFTPPIGSADVYNYVYRARVNTVYNENPYTVATGEYANDIFYNFSPKEWNYLTMQYGPFWTSVSIAFSNFTGDNFFWNVFIYKLLAVFSFFGTGVLLKKILEKNNPRTVIQNMLLYLWSPIIIFEAVNNAHNDMFMIFLVVFSMYLLIKKWYILSAIVLLLAVLTKYIPLLIVPVFLIYVFNQIQDTKKRRNFIWLTGVLVLLVVIFYYLPFWDGFRIFNGLLEQSKISTYANYSLLPAFVYWLLYSVGTLFLNVGELAAEVARAFGLVAFATIYLWLLRRCAKKGATDYLQYSFMALFAYVFIYLTYLQPWYLIWLIPLVLLTNKKYYPHFIFLCTLTGLLSYTIVMNSLIYVAIFAILILLSIVRGKNYLLEFFRE
jgi:alpha-1,6-mannosyltransferase